MKRTFLLLFVSLFAVPAFCADSPDNILRGSLALIGTAKQIGVRAVVMNDEVAATGQKFQRSMDIALKIRRPDGLRMDINADRYRRTVQYDGKILAIYDLEKKFYATADAQPTIDATMAMAREKLQLDLPLARLFAANAYDVLNAKGRNSTYVGLARVGAVACHHLAYTQDNVDWQIWIAADGPPLPRKIVIDYKDRPSRPQYIALLTDWNLDAKFEANDFRFSAPADAQKIDFVRPEGGSR